MQNYESEALRTLCDQGKALDRLYSPPVGFPVNGLVQMMHGCIGMMNELGEITSLMQKFVWYGKAYTAEELRAKIKDEASDILWHMNELLDVFGLTFDEVMRANIAKLRQRYPEKWTTDKAADENRDRAAEAAVVVGDKIVRFDGSELNIMTCICTDERIHPTCPYHQRLKELTRNQEAAAVAKPLSEETWNGAAENSLRATVHSQMKRNGPLPGKKTNAKWFNADGTPEPCDVPPNGWKCSRGLGHDGPCAATRIEQDGHGFGHVEDIELPSDITRNLLDAEVSAETPGGMGQTSRSYRQANPFGTDYLGNPRKVAHPNDKTPRCTVCDWPLAGGSCKPGGDCGYRPDDPAEQRRIQKRREELAATVKTVPSCPHPDWSLVYNTTGAANRCDACGVTISIS